MKKSILIILTTLFLTSGCVEETGYYSKEEENVISLICDNIWASEKTVDDEGNTYQGIYNFEKEGTYTQTLISTDQDGKEKKNSINGRWAFYDPGSRTIYFGYNHYWDIEELTSSKFAVYDRWGEYGEINMSREYIEFIPLE